MKKKQVCRKKAAALLAAACVAGNLPCGHVSVYAGETAAEIGDVHQEDETADQEAFGKETETVSGSAIQAVDAEADTQQEDSEGDIQDGSSAPAEDGTGSSVYVDADGVAYHYDISSDGTADIYDITDYSGKEVDIPAELEGHTVTRLTCRMSFGSVEGLTVPETVAFVGSAAFGNLNIGTLRYHALSAAAAGKPERAPFSGAEIGNLLIGENVDVIPERMFSDAVFRQEELVIRVPTVCKDAFWSAEFQKLTIGEGVRHIGIHAFSFADVRELCWNTAGVETYGEAGVGRNAPFTYASVQGISFGDAAVSVPADFVSGVTGLSVSRLEIPSGITSIGSRAFFNPYEENYAVGRLYIGENVAYLGDNAFDGCEIDMVEYHAKDARTDGPDGDGPFNGSFAGELHIGEDVAVLPAKIFCGMALEQEELAISGSIESVEDRALCSDSGNAIRIGTLTVGENVSYLGRHALSADSIGVLKYNAKDSGTGGPDGSGPFEGSFVGELHIGEDVAVLPAKIFCGISLEQEELAISGSIESVEDKALCSGSGNEIRIGTLAIGKNVSHLGMYALAADRIGVLKYNAADAGTNGTHGAPDSPFYNTVVGELQIEADVLKIPASVFAGIGLKQDILEFPAGVSSIGERAFQKSAWKDISFGTVVMKENVSSIGRGAFASCAIEKAHVCTLKSDWASGETEMMEQEKPVCGSVEIHGGSDYWHYFTSQTVPENITLLCNDFESSRGQEYFDAEKGCFVTPVTQTCTACGYQKLDGEYADAHTVIFADHDGTEILRQIVHDGENAQPPEEPERTGWRFTGWDKDYTGVTADLTVTAQYEICRFAVTFMDGETVLGSQSVEYGSSAKVPENPSRPDEAWGKWKFTGWDGNYTDVRKDESVYACFEKVLHEYRVVFYDADGKILSKQTVKHGGKAEAPQAPQKAADGQYTYVFKGWDADTENITSDTAIHPVYKAESQGSGSTITYTVTFMDGESVLAVQNVRQGQDASAPADPSRPDEAWGKWKFIGWDGSYRNITKDVTVYACYEKIWNEYQVLFYDADGKILSKQTVKHGGKAKAPQAPQKAADGRYTYVFKGWNADTDNIMADTAFHPVYEARKNSSPGGNAAVYKVTFMDGGTVLAVQHVEAGQDASAPAGPSRPDEAWGKWKFIGWDGSYRNITKDVTVYACYEKIWNEYQVLFYDADGKILSTQTVKHGGKAKAPQAPQKAADGQYTYVFKGWDADFSFITRNLTVHALFEVKAAGSQDAGENSTGGPDQKGEDNSGESGRNKDKDKNTDSDKNKTAENGREDMGKNKGTDKISGSGKDKNSEKGRDKQNGGSSSDTDSRHPVSAGSGLTGTGKGSRTDGNGEKPGSTGGRDAGLKSGGNGSQKGTGRQNPDAGTLPENGEAAGQPDGKDAENGSRPEPMEAEKEQAESSGKACDTDNSMDEQPDGEGGKMGECGKTGRRSDRAAVLLFGFFGVSAAVAAAAWLYVCAFRKKRVRGTVLDAEGSPVCGIHVLLNGEDTLETCTDRQGHFLFDNVHKGSWRLSVCHSGGRALLAMDIRTDKRDAEEIFRICSSHCLHVEHMRKKNDYVVDVTL